MLWALLLKIYLFIWDSKCSVVQCGLELRPPFLAYWVLGLQASATSNVSSSIFIFNAFFILSTEENAMCLIKFMEAKGRAVFITQHKHHWHFCS